MPASKMSLAMALPSPHTGFERSYPWNVVRTHHESKGVALPSIRQQFPDLHLITTQLQQKPTVSHSASTSPNTTGPLQITSPDYQHSPKKRRRGSIEMLADVARPTQVPRLYAGSDYMNKRQTTPTGSSTASVVESWLGSGRQTSPATVSSGLPTPVELNHRTDRRPTLPPPMNLERDHVSGQHHSREHSWEDHPAARPHVAHPHPPVMDPLTEHHPASYGYSYQHPSRYGLLSTNSSHSHDRLPQPAAYGTHFQDASAYGDAGAASQPGDAKQRKRRGNLPKETTDKLRSWFVAHLHHPYPTEDEKGELMRQTGLQMNQISNWFINARRRQLPAMINNARVESDAMNARASDGKAINSREHVEYAWERSKQTTPGSPV